LMSNTSKVTGLLQHRDVWTKTVSYVVACDVAVWLTAKKSTNNEIT